MRKRAIAAIATASLLVVAIGGTSGRHLFHGPTVCDLAKDPV